MTLPQTHTAMGSGKALSGSFALVDIFSSLVSSMQRTADQTIDGIEEEETDNFQQVLRHHPSWKGMEQDGRVSITKDHISYIVDNEGARDAEYGNPMMDKVASGVLRSHAYGRSEELSKHLVGRLAEGAGYA